MTWLVTGGAGYIGSHIVAALREGQIDAVVLDDLSTGLRVRVPDDVPFVQGSLLDRDLVADTLREYAVRGVVHLAAKKSVPESVQDPLFYYRENVGGMESLLSAMTAASVGRILYSSSAAVIGTPPGERVDEATPTRPESPYGWTKLVGEWMLNDVGAATGLNHISLRYFNVAGAGAPELGDVGVFNLIPLVFRALTAGEVPQVFGGDYPTRDGSCVRDYVHVVDVATAHVAAVRRLEAAARPDDPSAGNHYTRTLNVGRGEGVTVKEVMAAVAAVTGRPVDYVVTGRRPGDPAQVVGVVGAVEAELGWRAERNLEDMISSAWQAWQHRSAYAG